MNNCGEWSPRRANARVRLSLPLLPLRAADDSNSPASFALLDALYSAHARDGKHMLRLPPLRGTRQHSKFLIPSAAAQTGSSAVRRLVVVMSAAARVAESVALALRP